MTETELQGLIRRLADKHSEYYHHCTHPELCDGDPGFPDTFLLGRGGFGFAELKSATGQLSPAQRSWGIALCRTGPATPMFRVIRPADYESGEAEQFIRDLARYPLGRIERS